MFLISDEIYGNTTHSMVSPENNIFTSMFDVALELSKTDSVGEDVFIMYGFSKDIALSGIYIIIYIYIYIYTVNPIISICDVVMWKCISKEDFRKKR